MNEKQPEQDVPVVEQDAQPALFGRSWRMAVRLDPEDTETTALLDIAGELRGKRVLEIGCGSGRLTWRYAAQAGLVHAIDPKVEEIARAEAEMPASLRHHVHLFAGNLEQFHAPHPYDIAILSWSL